MLLIRYCGEAVPPVGGGVCGLVEPGVLGVVVPGVLGFVEPGSVVPGFVAPGLFAPGLLVLFGLPPGVVAPGLEGLCGFIPGFVPFGDVAVPGVPFPAGGVAVPAGGVAVLPGGVAVVPGAVVVPAGGVAVPAGGVAAPGAELCPAVPVPPPGAVPPAPVLWATTQLPQQRITASNVSFVVDILLPQIQDHRKKCLTCYGRPNLGCRYSLVIGDTGLGNYPALAVVSTGRCRCESEGNCSVSVPRLECNVAEPGDGDRNKNIRPRINGTPQPGS
ncbi:MAG TPA: hypothetical protein VGS27_15620 [Candidatus Sulfotelmatobacter sp.]|nr:hypothetical protein [Candidatus Sulfotelmatobacter sp.]